MTSVDRKYGSERFAPNPWEAARFYMKGAANDPAEALYGVKIKGKNEKAGKLSELTFYGYFDTLRSQPPSLHIPRLPRSDLRRLTRIWGKESNLYASVEMHT